MVFGMVISFSLSAHAGDTSDIAAYIGGQDRVEIYDIFQLDAPGNPKDKSILLAGTCSGFSWLPASMLPLSARTQLSLTALDGTQILSDSGGQGFIIRLSPDLKRIMEMVYFPANSGTSVTRIRTTVRTGDPVGELYISGKRFVSDSGYFTKSRYDAAYRGPREEYFIARLNNNFANGTPTAIRWAVNASCPYDGKADNGHALQQPWDVNNLGQVVYAEGNYLIEAGSRRAPLSKLDAFGKRMPVPGWMVHIGTNGSVTYGSPAPPNTRFSQIRGYLGYRGSLRSHNQRDFNAPGEDANSNARTGKYPDDFFYRRPVDSITSAGQPIIRRGAVSTGLSAGPGRTGRVADHPRTYGWNAIVFDKRNNNLYVGYVTGYYWEKPADSTNRSAWNLRHEFDPQVVAFDPDGYIINWDRLKKESSGDQPDSYIDDLDIDYANNMLVVVARQHGNGVFTSWVGNQIAANPTAQGFKNSLNGETGDIHIQWLGKLRLSDFKIFHSTFIAEFLAGIPIDQPYTNPKYDGWQNQNTGNFSLGNTRRIGEAANILKVARDGTVAITLVGARNFTTSDAFQKMAVPPSETRSSSFIRVYTPDLSNVIYSTIWSKEDAPFSNTVQALCVLPQNGRVLVAGRSGYRSPIKTATPAGMQWAFTPCFACPTPEYGILGAFKHDNTNYTVPTDTITYPPIPITSVLGATLLPGIKAYPNPVRETLRLDGANGLHVELLTILGKQVYASSRFYGYINMATMPAGTYVLRVRKGLQVHTQRIMKK